MMKKVHNTDLYSVTYSITNGLYDLVTGAYDASTTSRDLMNESMATFALAVRYSPEVQFLEQASRDAGQNGRVSVLRYEGDITVLDVMYRISDADAIQYRMKFL